MTNKTCGCAPIRPIQTLTHLDRLEALARVPLAPTEIRQALRARLVALDGGSFEMGTARSTFPTDRDSPRRTVQVAPFRIAPFTVTNADFADFVAATGHLTGAETEGWSYVFHLLLGDPDQWPQHPPSLPWWRRVDGAFWAMPEGPGSDWRDRSTHPVVHVSWYDAMAYCRWAGLRLPLETEWEFAARGGLSRKKFPWGDQMTDNGAFLMNTWQGDFPINNTGADGYVGTAPVDSFAPNGYGLWNTTGNVWEWVADPFDPDDQDPGHARAQRGGSYLCHVSYCDRYHVHSRSRNDADSATGHAGFRVAADG